MDVDLQPGKYVVAVSGGVDSMVLLDLLRQKPGVVLIVAHFDHGIRDDSGEDRKLVEQTAKSYGLPYESAEGKLGKNTSEATARQARYTFLQKVLTDTNADTIITAHHQDDVLETAIINLLRGTNRKGLGSLQSTETVIRPLLNVSKNDIKKYAEQNAVVWREDSTNEDESYLRNYVRRQLIPRLDNIERTKLLEILSGARATNKQLDLELAALIGQSQTLDRSLITSMSHAAARELIAAWLRKSGIRDFDRHTLERIVVAAKTAKPGSSVDAIKKYSVRISKTDLALNTAER